MIKDFCDIRRLQKRFKKEVHCKERVKKTQKKSKFLPAVTMK